MQSIGHAHFTEPILPIPTVEVQGGLPFYVMGVYKLRPQVRRVSWRAFKSCCHYLYQGI